jgi:hypothetical protein
MGLLDDIKEFWRDAWERITLPGSLDIAGRGHSKPTPSPAPTVAYAKPAATYTSKPAVVTPVVTSVQHLMATELTRRFAAWLHVVNNQPDYWSDDEQGSSELREQIRDKVEEFLADLNRELGSSHDRFYDIYKEVLDVYCEQRDYFRDEYLVGRSDDENGERKEGNNDKDGYSWNRRVG